MSGVSQIYNKHGTGARIGNWVEEDALKTLTGTHRLGADRIMNTNARTLAHTEREESKDWSSVSRDAQKTKEIAHLYEDRKAGPREARLERALAKEAEEFVTRKAPEEPMRFETTAGETFVRHSDKEYKSEKGRRVMKTLDGTPIPPEARDVELMASFAVSKRRPKLSPADTLHLTGTRGSGAAALASQAPISIYTQQSAAGVFNTTQCKKGGNPFMRDTKFTNPVMESEKAHAESRDYPVDWIPGVGKSLAAHAGSELTMYDMVQGLKAKIVARGGDNGIRTLARILKRFDSSGDGALSPEEFADGLREMGLDVPPRDVLAMVSYFDTDDSGKISVDELQRGLAGPMNARRMGFVREAFTRLDKTGDGVVTIEDLGAAYDTSFHPKIKSGEITHEEVLREFLNNFDSGIEDGKVTAEEFAQYYQSLSAGIPNDDYFELMMRNAWHISGGEGWSANTTCKRVLVRFNDGTEKVIEIKDDLGLKPDDVPAIKLRLTRQGVKNIAEVKLYE